MAETRGRLIIVCGLPGSGKSTLATALANESGGVRYAPDEWLETLSLDIYDEPRRAGIETLQWQAAQEVLKLGGTAIIEWGTWGRSERDRLREGARKLGAAVELIYLEASPEVLVKRIWTRGREMPRISRDVVMGWFEALEAPTPEEFALFDAPTKALPT